MAVVETRAQSGEWAVPSEAEQVLERSTPCSPEAAAIQRLAEFPMDYSTGVPNISVPVFEISVGEWSLPVAISYNASGVRVQEVASPVGLGWTLDAGGVVTRAIKGNVDDAHDMVFRNEYDVDVALTNHQFTNYEMHRIAIGASGDTESDRYSYSFGGRSGCFRRNVRDMSLRTIPYSAVRVEEVAGGFVITDTDGTRWHFTQEELSQDPATSDATPVTSWHPTKVVPAGKRDSLLFTYRSGRSYVTTSVTDFSVVGPSFEPSSGPYPGLDFHPYAPSGWRSTTAYAFQPMLLSTISWGGNTMTFDYTEDREDFSFTSGPLSRLARVTVCNRLGDTIRVAELHNRHYKGSTSKDKRMLLDSIVFMGSGGERTRYAFAYNATQLPQYAGQDNNCHEDFWGYYNGTNSWTWIPASCSTTSSVNNRRPNAGYAAASILERIDHPTGCSTVLEYEGNVVEGNVPWGGVRLRRSTIYDGSGGFVSRKEYTYDDGRPSMSLTPDLFTCEREYTYGLLAWNGMHSNVAERQLTQSSPCVPLNGDRAHPVYYGRVTESMGDLGKVEYLFEDHEPSLNNMQDYGHAYDPLFFYSTQYNIDRGVVRPALVARSVYEKTATGYKLKTSETYDYTEVPLDTFPAGVRLQESNVLINHGGIYEYNLDDYPVFHHKFACSDVWGLPSVFLLSSKSTSEHDGKVVSTVHYEYDPQLRTLDPVAEWTVRSDGGVLRKERKFPFDLLSPGDPNPATHQAMCGANMLVPVRERTLLDGEPQRTAYTEYGQAGSGRILPLAYHSSKGVGALERRVALKYDSHGNPSEVTSDSTAYTTLLWGYGGQCLVALVDGLPLDSVIPAIQPSLYPALATGVPPSELALAAARSSLTARGGLVRSWLHKPLVGVTAAFAPNGEVTRYGYDGMGRLASVRDHHGNLLFENGELSRLLVDGGYVTFTNGTPHYHFHLKDHLGSSRVVFSETGVVEQETQYYPYGGIMADLSTGQDAQRHKYNGKELDRMHGLDWYDYGARHYDAVIGRWTTMDPLCEKYYDVSPYAYCVNNPVRYVDIDGKNPGDHFASLYEAVWDFSWIYNVLSIEKNIEYLTKFYYVQTADNDSYYTYLDPNSGNENSVKGGSFDYSVLNIHDKLEMIAYGHTHADWDKNLIVDGIDWNDNFSGDQFNSEKNKQGKGIHQEVNLINKMT